MQSDSPESRFSNALARGLPILAREAIARIDQNGRYNTGHHGEWPKRVIRLNWRGQTRSGWNVRDLDTATGASDRFVALLDTSELLLVAVGTGEIRVFDPKDTKLTAQQLASIWMTIIGVVDDYTFRDKFYHYDVEKFIDLIAKMT